MIHQNESLFTIVLLLMPLFAEMPAVAPGCEDHSGLEEGPDVKPELPVHVSVAKDVMERCVHLLSHPSIGTRLKVQR